MAEIKKEENKAASFLDLLKGNIAEKTAQLQLTEAKLQTELLKSQNATLLQLLANSTAIYKLNRLTPGFITMAFTVTTTSQLIYTATEDRIVTLAHPAISTEPAGMLFFGANEVTTTSGYPLIAGDVYPFFIEKDTQIWAVSDSSAILHLLVN